MLKIQDSNSPESNLLHECLLSAFKEAGEGAGAYAFATSDGVDLLLKDSVFEEYISNNNYRLIIGIDAITNSGAINKLLDFQKKYKDNLKISVFINPDYNSTFHPKFSWFRNNSGGLLIIGSGNLTVGGLRNNKEAFATIALTKKAFGETKKTWNNWLNENEKNLKELSDEIVSKKAAQNKTVRVNTRKETKEKPKEIIILDKVEEGDAEDCWYISESSKVLLAEIPKNGTRISQVNFNKKSFEEFFKATAGVNNNYRILLKNYNKNSIFSDVEIRQSVSVISSNFRFELKAISGISYPKKGMPIGVFVETGIRTFIYTIFMPEEKNYSEIVEFMYSNKSNQRDAVRIISDVKAVKEACPNIVLWNLIQD